MPAAYAIPNLSKVLRLQARRKARSGGGARIHRIDPRMIAQVRNRARAMIVPAVPPVIWDPLGARVVRRTLTGGNIVRAQRNARRLSGL